MGKELKFLIRMIAAFTDPRVRTATAYVARDYTMRLSLMLPARKNARYRNFSLTLGEPNYEARKFIAAAIAAKERFPVQKIQLRFWPKDYADKKKARMRRARNQRKKK